MKEHDGGPAFPQPERMPGAALIDGPPEKGLSLLDYFAGQAITAIISENGTKLFSVNSVMAYDQAEAMLTERAHRFLAAQKEHGDG